MAEVKINEQALREAFDLHDHQGKNRIASAELGNALRSVGKRLTNEHVKRLVKKCDDEFQGSLSFDDFKTFFKLASEMEKRDEDLRQAFLVFDNGSGKGIVDVKTLKHALTTLGDKLTADEVHTLLTDAGFDEKREETIDYDKFMKLIQANV